MATYLYWTLGYKNVINPIYSIGEVSFALSDIVGVVGVIILLWSYLWLQLGRISQNAFLYSVANFISSLFIMYSLLYNWNLSSFTIECAWLTISSYGMIKFFMKKLTAKETHSST